MLFRQLFDRETSTYTYLLADAESGDAVLIDPVREQLERDCQLIEELRLRLLYALETHVHADHVTSAARLRERLGCQLVVGAHTGVRTADLLLEDGEILRFGRHELEARSTPGHTNGCTTWVVRGAGMAFTGDALFIRGCGRTDFQGGDARTLYEGVWARILSLPDDTLLYPGHDYKGRTVTTVREEKRFNPRLGRGNGVDDFVRIMAGLHLAYPARMDEAVPANLTSGISELGAPAPASEGLPVISPDRQDVETWRGAGI